ncbi:molecular chaperone [Enterobacter cloacae complex sp. P4RS]|nr:molecular chaperone [Enterobacter cloacae complex sp. P4RS]MBE4916847.1 molecular chaperone [Enterobacter cloacae complex sp. P4RS]
MANAALTLNADRLVYNAKDGDASVTVHSDESRAYLVQAWVDDGDNQTQKKLPFVTTPPLFRLAPKSDNVIRVLYTGNGLPQDRESLFWLNVKGVPGLSDDESQIENRMVIAINNRIKLFFRPEGLQGSSVDAIQKLTWTHNGKIVKVQNNTAFYAVLGSIQIGSENIKVDVVKNNTVIPPYGYQTYEMKNNVSPQTMVAWDGITEFGGTTEKFKKTVE